MRDLADACLDGLADMARVEARFAALKVLVAAAYVRATDAMAAPAVALQDAKCQEMAMTAEVACVLTVGAGTAGAFLGDCLALTNRLPLTLKALQAGTISWAHARAMVDETANLDPAGAAALEAHFLDPDAPEPGPRLPGRGPRPAPVPLESAHVARTPPPGQHRKTPRQKRQGPAGRIPPGL